jgi:hypothetical protein
MLAVTGVWSAATAPTVQADTFGRALEYGYYDGRQYSKGAPDYWWYAYMFDDGIPANHETVRTTADIFVNDLRTKLNSGNNVVEARASMVINVMMGVRAQDTRYDQPDSERYRNGIRLARQQFNRWERIVRAYDACTPPNPGPCTIPGASVNFNETYDLSDTLNGYGVAYPDDGPQLPETVFAPIGGSNEDMIVFRHANGTTFTIKKKCGNLTGDQNAFPEDPPPGGSENPPTPPTPPNPPGYTQGDSNVNSSCFVISGRAQDPRNAGFAVPIRITYRVGGNVLATDTGGTASTTGNRTFSRPTPPEVRSSLAAVSVTVEGRGSDNQWFQLTGSPISIGPCRTVPPGSCGSFTIVPSVPDPNTAYEINLSVTYSDPSTADAVMANGGRFYANISGPNVNYSDANVRPVTNNGAGRLSVRVNRPATGAVGVYRVQWGITGPFGAVNCADGVENNGSPDPPVIFSVANRPFVSVRGGDVSAGTGISLGGTDCAVPSNQRAGIVSWNQGSTGGYAGAGTQYAGLALGRLQEFATAQGGGLAPSGLAFANTSHSLLNPDAGLYGGRFEGGNCVRDYFEGAQNVQQGDRVLSQLAGFPAGGAIADGQRLTYYITGNLYVDSNVRFNGSYANASLMPSFRVVVRGNIYIAPNVTQLDGAYIAQPRTASAADGNIYTCAPTPFAPAGLDVSLHNACNNALVVNGSFSARQVWLLRSAGTVSSGVAAETFNYTPEIWLSVTGSNPSLDGSAEYDSITSLPPVL